MSALFVDVRIRDRAPGCVCKQCPASTDPKSWCDNAYATYELTEMSQKQAKAQDRLRRIRNK